MSAPARDRRCRKRPSTPTRSPQKDNDDALAAMKATGKTTFYEPTKAEREALCTAMHPVYEQMADRVGKDLIAAIQQGSGGARLAGPPARPLTGRFYPARSEQ